MLENIQIANVPSSHKMARLRRCSQNIVAANWLLLLTVQHTALEEFKTLFLQRNIVYLTNGCYCWAPNNYWIKIPHSYPIANGNVYTISGPPPYYIGYPSHYINVGSFPPGNVPAYERVPYFMAGSSDTSFIGEPFCKTWISNATLDWYLVNLRTLSNNYAPVLNLPTSQVWSLTNNTDTARTTWANYYAPCYPPPNDTLFRGQKIWRRWDIGVFYANQTNIYFPNYFSL